ncbi:structural protein [Cyanophage S-RIM12_Sn_07_0910]|uniref:Structural protein n=1 Tax=Cyanophage S-RIM12 TaxID=1278402 RepID=A0A1D7SWT2_9CAUD|nr:structural protein [Cyanophage S-RIM12_Sn_07_0910]
MDINKVSHVSSYQTPQFIESEYPLFNKFIEYYYQSQEKTGLGQNIINNFLQYLDIDKLDIGILDGVTKVVDPVNVTDTTITVETVDPFLEKNGSILIGDEVIYYEETVSSPNIALTPGISYTQVQLKWVLLANNISLFDGVRRVFPLVSQDNPIGPSSPQHIIVKVYGKTLTPVVDYTVSGTNIVYTIAPRTATAADDTSTTSVTYLNGFSENTIVQIDDISSAFGDNKTTFELTVNSEKYEPIADEFLLAVYDDRLLVPKVDYFIDGSIFIFNVAPLNGRSLSLYSIEAPIPSFGSGAVGYSRVNDLGNISSVIPSTNGFGYRFDYPPKVSVNSSVGSGASVKTLVDGIKSVSLLSGGAGYSESNPPTVKVQFPTKEGYVEPTLKATVTNGAVSAIDIISSGSGYTFTPRITFEQPGGAVLAPPTIVGGSVSGAITITNGGQGYTTPPLVYIDEPTGLDGIKASFTTTLTDGEITAVNILNAGQGYETVPRISVIDPVGAQVLETVVDGDGRVISVELLFGGSGYTDVPSVYIVDNRQNDVGTYIGGTGATAVAAIFNGQITDINITNFGTGYSADNPPQIVIQKPVDAKASATVGLQEITGFSVLKAGKEYTKAQFLGCARAASGITDYTQDGNAVFSNSTTAAEASTDTSVKCLDALFIKRLLDKYTEQFLPDVPTLDYSKIDVRTSIKTIKDFYSAKGTSFSIAYLFKLLYGETVTVSYPKDQIIKPSAATWSVDTVLRATLVSGLPENIQDGLLEQVADISDPNILAATALIENFISIQTAQDTIYELALSEETIEGTFVVPYKTKLAEPLNTTEGIITVDSTIGWPERNGEFVISSGVGSEVVQYKEKSLNQFIECTRSVNGVVEDWDSATQVSSNFNVFINRGTAQEVVLNIVGIVDAQQTTLTDTGSYYLPGDKLLISKLGGTGTGPELTTWLYNVKKLIEVESIAFGGINNQSATVTCSNPHGLLVGDQVTIYGANPIIYNGSFLVTSRDSTTVFQYQLPQPANVVPQGNILVSIDLNKGKSDSSAVNNAISPYTTNVQNTFFNTTNTYIASTGIPNYNIGPFPGSALLPGNQRKLNRFPITPVTISTKNLIVPGPIGTWVNGVSIWSYKSDVTKIFGAVTSIAINNAGNGYDAALPPAITISGGGGTGAAATATVNGSISEVTVTEGGSGYTSSPLVSIVGGGGSGASATAIITKGVVSSILVNSGGTGYTSQPSITVVGGGGSGAEGTAAVRGPIQSVAITNGGASYTSNPSIILSSGAGAVAQAIINDGRIISIAIISAGSGYTTAPEVTIQGDGFGAVARATIDVDGENAGKVTGIEIVNRGIGYSQGTTIINLNSVGQGASFLANVFQWTYNLQETTTVDSAKGSVFEGFNNQYGGEYAHLSNPQRLRYILGDNLFANVNDQILEQDDQLGHSPIIGWAFDGNPIYGPYGYSDPTNQSSSISRLRTSYRLKANLVYDEVTNPTPVRTDGPLLSEEIAGKFVEDYEYSFSLGDLDQYNGRFCKTPEYPTGRYCYFVTIDATEQGNPVFPYILGPSFNSVVDTWNLSTTAVQQNIPIGVVRYRDPYENVDIDVERAPNASTNGLTLENGDILTFDVEDENRDGVISAEETADPDQIFEESPLQLFDYFPTVKLDSKVDIEVETITKFEDASITGFVVENAGINYQVDDRLIFDNTDTGGDGASARISRIKGETVSAYTFENVSGNNFGVLTTSVPHNLQVTDTVFVDYTPIMDNTNKTFVVRQFKGIENITIAQSGSGYNEDIPPTLVIDGDGVSGKLEAVVTSVGSIDTVNILNSGSGYTSNPRVIISHPQVFKKAEYIVSKIENNENVKVNDIFVNNNKEIFICGKTLDSSGNSVAFVSKLSTTGVKEWEKTLELSTGTNYAEFQKLYVDGDDIWVVGVNRPNILVLDAYNPDIILVKYTQSDNGLSASLQFQKGYSGISGATRADNITCIKKYSDTRYVIGGFTNTNSGSPFDAFIALIDTAGSFAIKRKIASVNDSEKLTDIVVDEGNIYFTLETSNTNTDNNVNVAFGKATVGTNSIQVEYVNEYSNAGYSFLDSSLAIDEFKELYINATLRAKSDNVTRDSVWVGKVDTTGEFVWNYRYLAPGRDVNAVGKCAIDIFGDLNIAFNRVDNTTGLKTVDTVKIGYDGVLKNHTTNEFNEYRIEGITAHSIDVDNSGDVYVFGQTSWNRNEFLLEFTGGATTDTFGNYTPTFVGADATQSLHLDGGVAKIYGRDVATPANWENAYIEFPNSTLGNTLNENWTLEFMLYQNSASTDTHSQDQQTLVAIGDATDATGGLWLYYDRTAAGPSGYLELIVTNNTTSINSAGGAVQSSLTTMFADDTWQFIGLKKEDNLFTVYVNGISVITATVADTSFTSKKLYIGNIAGRNGTTGNWRSDEQGQYFVDNLKLRNRAITPTVPSDVSALPTSSAFGLSYSWTDTSWFDTYNNLHDYIDYSGWGVKVDKNADATRIGDQGIQLNTQLGYVRTAVTPVTGSALTIGSTGFALGSLGLQSLDFDDATTTMSEDTETLTYTKDIWSSRTATIPSPGSQKLIINAVVKDRYYFKVTDTVKIDNIQILTINQAFRFTVGTKLVLNDDSGSFINSGYITKVDNANNKVYLAINNNSWTNDLNTGQLSTSQFDEQSTYGIVGPIPLDINQIDSYTFAEVDNTTPGTFTIDLDKYNLDGTYNAAGSQNLDSFAKFKPYSDDDYSVRIDEISGSSTFIVGSVVTINGGDISYNAAYSTATITNLTGVLKITLVANLTKILRVTAVSNSDEVYVITDTRHYLTPGSMLNVDGNPSETVNTVVYDEYDGSFPVDTVISPLEFTYKLPQAAITSPATSASNVSIYIKSPVLKMYYGHQYLFDLSHSSMVGGNLSFSKDPLYKLEYSFNSIERVGTPGVTGEGATTPTVKFKVDEDVVTNISYYFDPSRVGDNDSPIIQGSYLDVVSSPYRGTFQVSGVAGATITRGADQIKFPLQNEPEGNADVSRASYSTSSRRAVGSIDNIRIVNPGGFYTRLPIVDSIQSTRQIERVTINEPGTEYAVGQYTGVSIAGDGEGGFVTITVADGTDAEGGAIPGQVQSVIVTSPGKGYTTATVDIDSVPGILGAGLTGSGAEVTVVIPPFGTAASIFTVGSSVGKIKKLKNNNFGYDYPHDYTLRPEITFPINAQLTSTSILDSVTVTDPGSGYSQAPAVIITGGGGTGAIAQSTIKNGRLDRIEVKDPGLGYSSTPTVELKSSFNYVVNLDLGLLQFSFPHGIAQGSAITLAVVDTGDGAEFPIAAGAVGRLNGVTTYYAISGAANSLEDDQLKFAITPANAALGDALSFTNAGTGRQQVLTTSFGGAATANVITSTFLEGEQVYQGSSFENATAFGFVSTNNGWQVGPRIVKIVDYTGEFNIGESVTGVISKSSGTISSLNIATGVLDVGSITETSGQFIDDVGKPSEIIQKIQDSYYYQDFSYAVKSAVSINDWKDILIKNVHPASFKVFGELNLNEYGFVPNKETFFQLTKSVELARQATVPNIQSFALVEPVYTAFDNTEVLFRQKRLTSSENILTSVVQRLDDISNLFDGERISFPLQIDGSNVVANANQLMIILNGVVQTPDTSFEVQNDSIVFAEPPQPPASVKYVNVTIQPIQVYRFTVTNNSGIFPSTNNTVLGTQSGSRLTVTSVVGDDIFGFVAEGNVGIVTALDNATLTSGAGYTDGTYTEVATTSSGVGTGLTVNITVAAGAVTQVSINGAGVGYASSEVITIAGGTTSATIAVSTISGFNINELISVGATGFTATLTQITPIVNLNLFSFNEQIKNLTGKIAVVEEVNLETGDSVPLADLRYTVGAGTSSIELIDSDALTDTAVPASTFTVGANYQLGAEIVTVSAITVGPNSTTLTVTRGQLGTTATSHQEDLPLYGTDISVTNELALSKTVGTYQSKPGLFDIQLDDVIIGSQSGVVARITSTSAYQDPTTNEFIEQVNISDGSSFFGLLFNRLTSASYPNIILDNIAESQVNIVDFTDNTTNFDSKFPGTEFISNLVIPYDNTTGTFQENEIIRNYKLGYGNVTGVFNSSEDMVTKKLAFDSRVGSGFFQLGQVIRTQDTKGEVIGYNQALSTIYLGKVGRTLSTGEDYHKVTFNNNAQLDTDQSHYGLSSLLLDGTGDYLSIPTSTEFGFGTGAFTIECWIRPSSVTGTQQIFDFRTTAVEVSSELLLVGTNLNYRVNNSTTITGTATLAVDTWYHVAISRNASTTKLFVNGTQDGGDYSDGSNYGTTKPIIIGASYAFGDGFAGHIDEFRVSNTSRYQTTFTAPTGIFQGDANTKLLLHFEGDDTQTYIEDWSGGESFTDNEDFNNDAILKNWNENSTNLPAGFAGKSQRYYDAANLIESNKNFVAKEAVYLLTQQYPSLIIPGGNVNCEDDIRDILTAMIEDLRNGCNSHIWDASALYVDRTANPITISHVDTEVTETVWAYDKVKDILQYIINNTLWSVSGSHGVRQITDTTITDSSTSSFTTLQPSAISYNAATGDMVMTSNGHGLTTSNTIAIAAESLTFTCTSDGNERELIHPRKSDTRAYNQVLAITAADTNTFTVNVGASPAEQQYVHTFVSATSGAVTVLNYTTGDCADVYSTIGNLLDILTDTLEQANLGTPVDHLATITKVTTEYEFVGATVNAYLEVPFSTTYHSAASDILYTNRIDVAGRGRFRDASNLINANASVIVDKAAFDMLARYPDLAVDMPRNADGSSTDGTLRCKTDLGLILGAIAKDIYDGGNFFTVQAAKFYIGENDELRHIRLQVWQSVYAHDRLAYYAKQAVTGDLTYDNTDNIIVGDWGVTNDAGNCANVQSAIDTLVTTINDIIAPTSEDFNIAGDRLYFNREYIAEEITGLTAAYLTYQVDNTNQVAYTYDVAKCERDIKLLITAIISDLQTGGNNSTVDNMNLYLTANGELNYIEEELLPTVFAFEQIRSLGEKAIRNLLYDSGSTVSGQQYAAIFSDNTAYRDSETPTDIDQAVWRLRDLVDIVTNGLAPAGNAVRNAAKNFYFNLKYYKDEIGAQIDSQFGAGSWVYDSFLEETANNIATDSITTDTSSSNTVDAYEISLSNIIGDFTVGETVTSSNGTTATVLEFDKDNQSMYVGTFSSTAWAVSNTLTGGSSSATATIAEPYGSVVFDGTGDYLQTAAGISLGTGNFTIEGWIRRTDTTSNFYISGSTSNNFGFFVGAGSSSIGFYGGSSGNFVNLTNTSLTISGGRWYHVAVVREGTGSNQTSIYIDGILQGSGTIATNYGSTTFIVGASTNTAEYADGNISDWRLSSVAVYPKGTTAIGEQLFALPTRPFVAADVTETELLLCQGDTIQDNGPNTVAVTANGDAAVSTISPFGYFPGVSNSFDWYVYPTNVEILSQARAISSPVTGEVSSANLWTNPENLNATNYTSNLVAYFSNVTSAPDGTETAEKLYATGTGVHSLTRDFNLTSFETFDNSTVTFDSGTETFDTGFGGISEQQTFTLSAFFKKAELDSLNFKLSLDTQSKNVNFNVNLSTGQIDAGTLFVSPGITLNESGVTPVGSDWFRVYATITFGFGIDDLQADFAIYNRSVVAASGNQGFYIWGIKLNSGFLDPYTAGSGKVFYSNTEYNIKTYALDLLTEYMIASLSNELVVPSPIAVVGSFYQDPTSANALSDGNYNNETISRLIRYGTSTIKKQFINDAYYTNLIQYNAVSFGSKNYGVRDIPTGITGGLNASDYFYGLSSDSNAELANLTTNEGLIVKVYRRFRIDGDITDGPFTMNETVAKQGAPSITGVVYGFYEDENFKYLDVEVTAGPWAVTDFIVGATNSTTAQISAIEDRIHIIDLKGNFVEDIEFLGYTSGAIAQPTSFLKTEASVTSNSGGLLTVDTESLVGTFEKNSVVYPESSRQYIDVSQVGGLQISVGDRIASDGYIRLGISVISTSNTFIVGNRIYKVVNNLQDNSVYGVITEVDLDNNYIYITMIQGEFQNGDYIGDYGVDIFPQGFATISTKVTTAGAAAARVQDIRTIGLSKRLYLTEIAGTFSSKDAIIGTSAYKAVITDIVDLKARVKRSSKGFDGTQTNFSLTIENGTQYLPDPEGHMLIFINGILQPPGATNAYTAFSDQIQFAEAPELGSSFTGFYIGKLRQLDDISFEFDSLRQSFNLKRNEVFYSLTLTEGVQSTVIRPENNIIVSLNGVVQEPGVGFEIVGSRIIFSEIPRVDSTFVAFSYVGSEADVDAAEVVPPIEAGDFIEIEGETVDREVAVIESSNSLITFDYLGSVFGQGAIGQSALTSGFIRNVQVTSGGSGYTSRPTVRIDSISGFDGNIRALIGISSVEMNTYGSGYQNPVVVVESEVPDDWTAPNLANYGEELIDPEIA